MKAQWKSRDICDGLPYIIIESGPTIKELYFKSKHLLNQKGILIVGIDGPTLLSKNERNALAEGLTDDNIPYQLIGSFIWVERSYINNLLESNYFGSSGDTCFFFEEEPNNFSLHKIPYLKGVWKERFPEELIHIFEQSGSNVVYMRNAIPDMLIVTNDQAYLNFIDNLIQPEKNQNK